MVREEQLFATEKRIECPEERGRKRFVTTAIDPRVRGLSIEVDFSPDRRCNFDCLYCEEERTAPPENAELNVLVMAKELKDTLRQAFDGSIREWPCYQPLSAELMRLRQVTISGNGEPTLSPHFVEGVESIVQLRSQGPFPFFKLVLSTNASRLDQPQVQEGLSSFTLKDEIWVKLDAGTQHYMDRINRPDCTLEKITANILYLAQQRPVVVQSLFPMIDGSPPSIFEIESYVHQLEQLESAGAQIALVQIYSAFKAGPGSRCTHLDLKQLNQIARRVTEVTGLKAEVF